jgi:hypothetical protein
VSVKRDPVTGDRAVTGFRFWDARLAERAAR